MKILNKSSHFRCYNIITMATGSTPIYNLPYPTLSDPVNVSGDIQSLAEQIENVIPAISPEYQAIQISNNSGSNIQKGDPVYISGYDSIENKPEVSKSIASDISTFPVIGLAQSAIANGSSGVVITSGIFNDINTSSFSNGARLYVGTSGGLTSTQPASGSGIVGVVSYSSITGTIIVGAIKGNGTWGSLKAGLA